MGREVGGGIGMGKTCEPKAFSFQCMTEFTTKKKKRIKKILIGGKLLYNAVLISAIQQCKSAIIKDLLCAAVSFTAITEVACDYVDCASIWLLFFFVM